MPLLQSFTRLTVVQNGPSQDSGFPFFEELTRQQPRQHVPCIPRETVIICCDFPLATCRVELQFSISSSPPPTSAPIHLVCTTEHRTLTTSFESCYALQGVPLSALPQQHGQLHLQPAGLLAHGCALLTNWFWDAALTRGAHSTVRYADMLVLLFRDMCNILSSSLDGWHSFRRWCGRTTLHQRRSAEIPQLLLHRHCHQHVCRLRSAAYV